MQEAPRTVQSLRAPAGRNITRRDFVRRAAAAAALAFCACDAHTADATARPNFVFILIDDMGFADLGCFGSDFHETPNLDTLAAGGMRFTNAYAAAPVCSPTRASIMTGKYPARLHLTNFLKGTLSPEDSPVETAPYADELPLEEVTLAEALRECGYATGHVGKWHLGNQGFWPEQQGFDVNVAGSASGMPKGHFWPAWKGNPPIEGKAENVYLADLLTDEACRFIEEHQSGPFYLNLCHYSVHIPIQAKPEKIAKYEAKLAAHPGTRQHNPHYAAMVESVDESVGRIVETLRRCGIEKNTVLVFFSDNGGLSVEEGPLTPATDNYPFRAGKGFLYEGGIREPMIVSWPGTVPAGTACETPVCSVDFLPTFCAIAGAKAVPPTDGRDVSALFHDPAAPLDRDALFWHYPHFANQGGRPSGAIREGDWKLIEDYEFGQLELYNLREDPGEQHDLADAQPERMNRMLERLQAWRSEVNATMPPRKPRTDR